MDTSFAKKYVDEKLRAAIATMKTACYDAERDLEMYEKNWTQKPQAVMHDLTWGLANASSSIESAMNTVSNLINALT